MSLITDVIDRILDPILAKLKEALGPFGKLFDLLGHFWTNITTLWTDIDKLVTSIRAEISAWKNFKESINFRSRVINLKIAIEKSEDFIRELARAKDSIMELWTTLKGKFETTGDPAAEAEDAVKDIEQSGLKDILAKFPKLLKGAEKVLGFVAIVTDALESIITGVHDLQTIVDTLRDIREEIESLATVFLSQKNPRRRVRLADGSTMRIRVGSLHS
jgi:uncharacterized phage infection (PIP) family protein YhgE